MLTMGRKKVLTPNADVDWYGFAIIITGITVVIVVTVILISTNTDCRSESRRSL